MLGYFVNLVPRPNLVRINKLFTIKKVPAHVGLLHFTTCWKFKLSQFRTKMSRCGGGGQVGGSGGRRGGGIGMGNSQKKLCNLMQVWYQLGVSNDQKSKTKEAKLCCALKFTLLNRPNCLKTNKSCCI